MPRAFKTKMCIIGKVTTMQENPFWGMPWKSIKICVSRTRVFSQDPEHIYRQVLGFLGSPLLPGEIVWREEITMIWLSMFRPGRAGHPSVPSDKKQVLINFQSAPELLSFLLNIQRV